MTTTAATTPVWHAWFTLAQAGTPVAGAGPATPAAPVASSTPAPSTQELLGGQAAPGASGLPAGTTGTPGTPGTGGTPPGLFGGGAGLLLPLAAVMIFMLVMSSMTGRKEKKRRADLLSSLRRSDKVVTIGGLIGTIVEVRDDEVVLKVDEATGAKVRFTRSSIQQVIKSPESAGSGGSGDVKVEVRSGKPEKAGV